MRAIPLLLACALAFDVLPVEAQAPPLGLEVRPGDGGVRVTLGDFLEHPGLVRSVESGLPVRIRIVVELWRDRFVDAQEDRFEWRATYLLDPLAERYRVETGEGAQGELLSLAGVRGFMQGRLLVPLHPDRPGRYYYVARIEVETLSLSDLDELRRWLRGDLGPAVERGEEVGGALGRGLRRLLVRALGLPVQRYQTRSSTFAYPG